MDPTELGGALVGALIAASIAAVGYIGRLAVNGWQEWRAEQRRRVARLLELDALLSATSAVFDSIQRLRHELTAHLLKANPEAVTGEGFERLVTSQYAHFDEHAKDLHTVIRGYTIDGLGPLNNQLLVWLRKDVGERAPRRPTPAERSLATGLRELDRHLVVWLAKFPVWMSDAHPEHSVVFLDDEQKHGRRFPPGMEAMVRDVLAERGIEVAAVP